MSLSGDIAMTVLGCFGQFNHIEITDLERYLDKAQRHNRKHPFRKLKDHLALYTYLKIDDCPVIIIRSKKAESKKGKAILYLHGGITNDWEAEVMVARGYANHTGLEVWYPVYPTVTQAPADEILEMIFSVYRHMEKRMISVALIGTSFGGTFGFSLINKINRVNRNNKVLSMPHLYIAHSPGGVPQTKEDWAIMKEMAAYDPLIDLSAVKNIIPMQGLLKADIPEYIHSPMYGDFSEVPDTYVYYALETLAGNHRAYVQGYEKYGVSDHMHIHIQPGMMHGYSCLPVFKESKQAYVEQITLLKK